MRVNYDHRFGHYRGRHNSHVSVAITILIVGSCAYGANRAGLLGTTLFARGYLNDIIAIPMLLAYTELLAAYMGRPRFTDRWPVIFTVTVFAGIYWEYIGPLYWPATSDPLDLLAFIAGACIFAGAVETRKRLWDRRGSALTGSTTFEGEHELHG